MAEGGDEKPMILCWARASAECGKGGAIGQRAGMRLPQSLAPRVTCEDKVGSVGEEVTGGLGPHQPGPRFTRCPQSGSRILPTNLPLLASWSSLVTSAALTAGWRCVCVRVYYCTILRLIVLGPAQVRDRRQAQVRGLEGMFPKVSQTRRPLMGVRAGQGQRAHRVLRDDLYPLGNHTNQISWVSLPATLRSQVK